MVRSDTGGGLGQRLRLRVTGTVQGVGFRPFVFQLATGLSLAGHVGNDSAGVFIEVEGAAPALERFCRRLRADAPPLSVIESVESTPIPGCGGHGFTIVTSARQDAVATRVPADAATCAECRAEILASAGPRAGYAFTNCTGCGPRYTIIRDMPYDRAQTTMAGFAMCAMCSGEYGDPSDRRFHAQPTCCPRCGPALRLVSASGEAQLPGDPIAETARLLGQGAIVGVKGLGGFHLATAATGPGPDRLRLAKQRDDKPFAVMVADLAMARRLVEIDDVAGRLLADPAAPIVLLPRRAEAPVAASVAPRCPELGVMLAYTPLHHLLLRAAAAPIVLTSGNVSDEPIVFRDGDVATRLAPIADAVLTHDRPIWTRAEDSVARVFRGRPMMMRRSRGFVPAGLALPFAARQPVLGCGAELKTTFCLAEGGEATLSGHIGDLTNPAAYRCYQEQIERLERLCGITPQVLAHDMHPQYLSTAYAQSRAGVRLIEVQHHHAHIASCLADNGEAGPVLGVAFDGLGYGDDATLWGGELLVADLVGYRRAGHLAPMPMPGGAAATREPWRMALSYLDTHGKLPDLPVVERHRPAWLTLGAAVRKGINAPLTTSAGRLFDAVAAVLDVRDRVTYEGQAAIELEHLAAGGGAEGYLARLSAGDTVVMHGEDLFHAAVADRLAGLPATVISARFHAGLATLVADACRAVRDRTGLASVALSGGVFQNTTLLGLTIDALTEHGFRVLTHSRVPPNDGGISLGQVAIAAARLHLAP